MTNPTIGIEIELPWRNMLNRVDQEAAAILVQSRGFYNLTGMEKARVQQGFDSVDVLYKDTVDAVFGEDIARGNDGYREFALRPQHEYQRLTEITKHLFTEEILVPNEDYSLHVTLGSIPLVQRSWMVLTALELSGGTTPERITQTNTWSKKGVAGIQERKPNELQLGATEGFEMRSLMLGDVESLDQILGLAQRMGGILLGRLSEHHKAKVTWKDVYTNILRQLRQKEVDASIQWPNPQDDLGPWQKLATALEDKSWQEATASTIASIVS